MPRRPAILAAPLAPANQPVDTNMPVLKERPTPFGPVRPLPPHWPGGTFLTASDDTRCHHQ